MIKPNQFEAGQTCYLADGTPAQYVGKLSQGHAVRPSIEWEDGYGVLVQSYGGMDILRHVFPKAPKRYRSAEAKRIDKQIKAAERKLEEMADKVEEAQSGYLGTLKRLKEVEGLQTIEAFVKGEFNFVVTEDYVPRLKELEGNALKDNDGDYRMISLYGDKHRKMSFGINQYSDGSGTKGNPCHFYKTREEAERQLDRLIVAGLENDQKNLSKHSWSSRHVSIAIDRSIPIPNELIIAKISQTKQSLASKQKDASQANERYQRDIDLFEQELAQLKEQAA